MLRIIICGLLCILASACSLAIPQVTPTIRPSSTPRPTRVNVSPSPTLILLLPTETLTLTASPTLSQTPLPSPELSATSTVSPAPVTATRIITSTLTASPTDTQTPTVTASPTDTASPLPTITISATPTLRPTFTRTPTATASFTPLPTRTPLPTATLLLSPTDLPSPTSRPTSRPTSLPTALPTLTLTPLRASPTVILTPTLNQTALMGDLQTAQALTLEAQATLTSVPATLAITPSPITATPGGDELVENTPIASTPEFQGLGPTSTPTLAPTVFVDPSLIQPMVTAIPIQFPTFSNPSLKAYTFSFSAGSFAFNNQIINRDVSLFAANPLYSDSYAMTDPNGIMYFRTPNGDEGTFTFAPFYEGFMVASAEDNKNRIIELEWSPDGRQLAYLINPPGGTDTVNAGVWFWQESQVLSTDPTYTLLRDCAYEGQASCSIVSGRPANHWRSIRMDWSPDSNHLLITMYLPDEGRQAVAVVQAVRDSYYANTAPDIRRYDSAYWVNANEIIVSGRRPSDGQVVIAKTDGNLNNEQLLFDASAAGLWVQDAIQSPNGRIIALGRPCCPDGPLQLMDGQGNFLSEPIGDAYPSRVEWFADFSGVVLTVNGRQYTAKVDSGAVYETRTSASAPPVVPADPDVFVPVGATAEPLSILPESIIADNAFGFVPGQNVRVLAADGLNLRASPSLYGEVIGSVENGEFVALLAGPYQADNYGWWKILTARQEIGWIAGDQNGQSWLIP